MAVQYIDPTTVSIVVTAYAGTVEKTVRNTFDTQLYNDLDDVFYNTEEFAITITYNFGNGTSQLLNVIFDEEHSSLNLDTEVDVIASEPMFSAHADKFLFEPDTSDSVIINNREFNVKEAHPDGTGLMVITLLRK